jgi:hypothetical protein
MLEMPMTIPPHLEPLRLTNSRTRVAFGVLCLEWTWETLLLEDPEARALVQHLWRYVTKYEDWSEIWDRLGMFYIFQMWDQGYVPEELLPHSTQVDSKDWVSLTEVRLELLPMRFDLVVEPIWEGAPIENRRWVTYPFGFILMVYLTDAIARADFSAHATEPYGAEVLDRALSLAAFVERQQVKLPDIQLFNSRPFFVPHNAPPQIAVYNETIPFSLLEPLRPPALVALQAEN